MGSERGPDQGDEGEEGEDPFEGLTLDESFVRAATVREAAAAERERSARQANLSRLLADQAAQRENREYERRRYATSDEAGSDDWDDWDVSAARRRRRRPLRAVALLVVIAIVLVYVVSDYLRSSDGSPASDTASSPVSSPAERQDAAGDDRSGADPGSTVPEAPPGSPRPDGWPPLPNDVSDEPLGTPGPVPVGGGPHSFVAMQEDGTTPVGYDPCRPVPYRTRPGGPDAAPQLVREAVAMVSAATGLQFVDEGSSDEGPSSNRPAYQPERYGERWAPVLISWSDATESPALGRVEPAHPLADVAGYAGSQPMGFSSTDPSTGTTTLTGLVFVTGSVVLDAPDLTAMLAEPDGYARARAVVAHELGHLVGLGHVDDPAQLMQPQTSDGVTGFGAGDLQGLSRVGSLECFPEI